MHYQVTPAVSFLGAKDELYWNVTGNRWRFPILSVSAHVVLPQTVTLNKWQAYTGANGEQGSNYKEEQLAPNELQFSSSRPLLPGEGFTIALSWPAGAIHEPPPFFAKSIWIAEEILAILLVFYTLIWFWEGRDPLPGTIIPLFTPPTALSPSGMRYLRNMGFDLKTVSTAIISLATQGYLTVVDEFGLLTLKRKLQARPIVTGAEKKFLEALFSEGNSCTLNTDSSSAKRLNQAQEVLKNALQEELSTTAFLTHIGYLVPGWMMTALALLAFWRDLSIAPLAAGLHGLVIVGGMLFFSVTALLKLGTLSKQIFWNRSGGFNLLFQFARALFCSFIGCFILVMLVVVALDYFPPIVFILVGGLIAINLIFQYLLKTYTPQGRKLLDQVEGFRLFLNTTEQDRLERLNPPEATAALYEKYLPYALALDVENSWGERFTHLLKKVSWYEGTAWVNANTFTTVISNQMGQAVATTLYSSSNSSSSFGSGSSGGGGGGGGGGGW